MKISFRNEGEIETILKGKQNLWPADLALKIKGVLEQKEARNFRKGQFTGQKWGK